jgi:release factor glutamine methyltransferase
VTEAQAVTTLRAAGCVFAEEEAAVLVAASADGEALARMVARRGAGEPIEQIVGYADFCGVRVRLQPGVFVPRARSELLVRVAGERAIGDAVVVDLCCGSGALGLAVKMRNPQIKLYATDADAAAVSCARDNLGGCDTGVYRGDLFDALPPLRADVLIANVPYVPTDDIPLLPAEAREHEPLTALDGGPDGLDVFRAVVDEAPRWLVPGGTLLSEITEAQTEAAIAAVRAAGLRPGVVRDDDLDATVVTGVHDRPGLDTRHGGVP